MDTDGAIRRLRERTERAEAALAELSQLFDTLLQMLIGRGELADAQRKMLERLRARSAPARLVLQLGDAPDKYAVANSEVDCAERMHLCQGRCCSFNIKLSRQDLEEGELAWRVDEPYYLRQTEKGRCVYQDETSGFCGNYSFRPAPCRSYDCRNDLRVWLDFDNRLPAPMPEGLVPLRLPARP